MGEKHQHLASSLVPELLSTHPFFATPEPSVDDPAYVAIVILVFNATAKAPTMLPLFADHTRRHYAFLRDSQPQLVPHLEMEPESILLDEIKVNKDKGTVHDSLLVRFLNSLSHKDLDLTVHVFLLTCHKDFNQ